MVMEMVSIPRPQGRDVEQNKSCDKLSLTSETAQPSGVAGAGGGAQQLPRCCGCKARTHAFCSVGSVHFPIYAVFNPTKAVATHAKARMAVFIGRHVGNYMKQRSQIGVYCTSSCTYAPYCDLLLSAFAHR